MITDITALVPYIGALCAVLGVIGAALALVSKRRYRFIAGRINGVTGELGGGKSMFVIANVLRPACRTIDSRRGLRCRDTGRPVTKIITNFTFLPAELGFPDVEVIRLAPAAGVSMWQQIMAQGYIYTDPDTGESDLRIDAIICMDEFAIMAPSDDRQLDPLGRVVLQHIRKWNCEFWWMTAPDVMAVHKRARKFSQRLWYCSPSRGLIGAFSPIRTFTAVGHKPDNNGDLGEDMDKRLTVARKRVLRSYRSYETIGVSAEDLAVIEQAISAAGLVRGESRSNDLTGALLTPEPVEPTIHHTDHPTVKNATGRSLPAPAGPDRRNDLRAYHGSPK